MEKKAHLALLLLDDDDLHINFSSSDEEDEVEITLIYEAVTTFKQRRTAVNNYFQTVKTYTDETFQMHFRLQRGLVEYVTNRFSNSQQFRKISEDNFNNCICAEEHILIFLWFAGHQTASFRDVADRFNVAISTLFDVITRVMHFLVELRTEVIKLPNDNEKSKTKNIYFQKSGLRNIVGAIDGSHIKIDTPTERPVDYFNRKSFYSIILQGVVNEERRFLDVCVGYPGSVHDARVFKNSKFYQHINAMCNDEFIVGDSAYPLQVNLLTPYRDNGHLSVQQRKFNKALGTCRVEVEHAFGILKQRFRQLYHLKLRGPKRICHFIISCCVLHNLATGDALGFDEDVTCDNQPATEDNITPSSGITDKNAHACRDNICRSLR